MRGSGWHYEYGVQRQSDGFTFTPLDKEGAEGTFKTLSAENPVERYLIVWRRVSDWKEIH